MTKLIVLILLVSPITAQSGFEGNLQAKGPNDQDLFLPLKETRVQLELTGPILTANIYQVFYNDTNYNLEARYRFPLPPHAAVTDMKLEFEDIRVKSVVKEKMEAEETYHDAVDQGHRAALLSQDTGNLFTTSVANFEPGDEVEIHFSFVQNLPFKEDHYELLFPTVFGQKYTPREAQIRPTTALLTLPVNPRVQPAVYLDESDEHLIMFQLDISGMDLDAIESPTHDIDQIQTANDHYQVILTNEWDLPNRDFLCRLYPRAQSVPELQLLQSVSTKMSGSPVHGMIQILPPLAPDESLKSPLRDVVFLCDTSGSMQGDAIRNAKMGLKTCLHMLGAQDRFNVVRFESSFSSFSQRWVPNDPDMIYEADRFIDSFSANGGTEMFEPLKYCLDLPKSDLRQKVIVFLTDGEVSNEDMLVDLVRNQLHGARLFTFGVGSAPNSYLLKKMSEYGNGLSHMIKNQSNIDNELTRFFETVNNPILTDVRVTSLPENGITFFPKSLPDVYLHRPLEIFFRADTPITAPIQIEGLFNGQRLTYEVDPQWDEYKCQPIQGKGMTYLFGKAWTDDLMFDYTQAKDVAVRNEIRQKVVDVALDYQLVTRFTSRVAVAEQKLEGPNDLMTVNVPLLRKAQSYPATATNDPLHFLIGIVLLILGVFCNYSGKDTSNAD